MVPSDLGSCHLVTFWPLKAGELLVSSNSISEGSLAENGGNLLKFILSQTFSETSGRIHPTPKEVGDISQILLSLIQVWTSILLILEKLHQVHSRKQLLQQSLECYRTSLLWISSC